MPVVFFNLATAYTYPLDITNLESEKLKVIIITNKAGTGQYLAVIVISDHIEDIIFFLVCGFVYSNTSRLPSSSEIIFEKYGK